MKDKPNEWVSIADLMAGVMAVVMLLLVVSVLQQKYAEIRNKEELEQGTATQKKIAGQVLKEMRNNFDKMGIGNSVAFDLDGNKITLKDSVFARGSACITPEAKAAILKTESKIAEYLTKVKLGHIVIEGHTDSLPVKQPVTDFEKFCTVYDDNFTLSAARAREARKLLIGTLSEQDAKRLTVAGFGDSHTLRGMPSSDARNRRVDILFSLQDKLP